MRQNSNEPREGLTPGVRESNAAGEANAIVGQLPGRRDAAASTALHVVAAPATKPDCVDSDAMTELWANAKIAWTARDFPKYGSREWVALTPDDPRRLAGALEAAEMWRKYGDEEELLEWFRTANTSRPPIWNSKTQSERDEAAKPKPPHQVRATPGWPPIAVPGSPGMKRHLIDGKQVDLSVHGTMERAA